MRAPPRATSTTIRARRLATVRPRPIRSGTDFDAPASMRGRCRSVRAIDEGPYLVVVLGARLAVTLYAARYIDRMWPHGAHRIRHVLRGEATCQEELLFLRE